MNLHDADLTRRLADYLERRQPPRNMATNERAKADQITAYIAVLRRFAPHGDTLQDWWGKFIEALSELSETWVWPTEKEIRNACKAASGREQKNTVADAWKPDPVAINLSRLQAGEPLGDFWLWGRGALQLVAAGADRHALRERRIAQAQQMTEVYDKDTVRALLAELKGKHERAEVEVQDLQRRHREMPETKPKRAFSRGELEALVA